MDGATAPLIPLAIIALTLSVLSSSVASQIIISISEFQMDLGREVSVPIELINSGEVAGGYVKIEYDESIVEVLNVTMGDFPLLAAKIDKEKGTISLAVASATAVGKSRAVLAKIRLKAVSTGSTFLNITYAELNDERGNLVTPKTVDGKIVVKEATQTITMTTIQTITATIISTYTLTINHTIVSQKILEPINMIDKILPYILLVIAVVIFIITLKSSRP